MMKASKELIKALKGFEGLRLESYTDSGDVWTIGYGHTFGVKKGQKITKEQAEALLQGDLNPREKALTGMGVWTQGQFDALLDFSFNFSIEKLMGSTLLRKIRLNASKEEITAEFLKWNKIRVGGKLVTSQWQTARRTWEAKRFFEV